ncbi:hypothetical protein CLU79DRAFT_765231 [Phycomyces nitens]|nr:hypothetical protein CLU79DRAFT_765231 [Phycomyces nitens]
MSAPNSTHDIHNDSTSNTEHHHMPSEDRDPVLLDDHFSLRYGNPIKIIHDTPKHAIDTFEPSKDHLPPIFAQNLKSTPCQDSGHTCHKNSRKPQRDPLSCSEFYHVNGVVEEK